MRLARMTTRRRMIVVLFVALVLGALTFWQRTAHFMRLAASHGQMAEMIRSSPSEDPGLADHHENLAKKYQYGADHPWSPSRPTSQSRDEEQRTTSTSPDCHIA